MNIKPFQAVFPKVDLITSPKSFFASIKYQYREYRTSGVYSSVNKSGYYLYRIETQHGSHTGIICSTSVDDLKSKKILPHEGTLAVKEQQMMHLLLQRKALVKPVLLGFNPDQNLQKLIDEITSSKEPSVKVVFENNEEIHTIWSIYDKASMQKVNSGLSKLNNAYIGDGHHRSTTIALLNASKDLGVDAKKYGYLLTAYFPFDQLQIWDFNRVVDIHEIMTTSRFIAALSKYFDIKELPKGRKPSTKHEVTFLIDHVWYAMKWKKKFITKEKNGVILDSALINKYVFQKILGIDDIRVDTRIKYFGGTEPFDKLIKQCSKAKRGIGLCIYPVSVEELTSIADLNKTLPPKSTFFLPRLRSGLIAKDL